MNRGQWSGLKRSLGNLLNKAGNSLKNVSQRYCSLKWIGGFCSQALPCCWIQRVFSPRKEHQCLTWNLNTHTKGFFIAHTELCWTVEKVHHAWKSVSLPLIQSKYYIGTKTSYLLSLAKWIVKDFTSERSTKDPNCFAEWDLGIWTVDWESCVMLVPSFITSPCLWP